MKTITTTFTLLLCSVLVGCGDNEEPDPTETASSAATLAGSLFEIDEDANLVVNTMGNLDWMTVADTKKTDLATGANDDSYGGGAKEDDACPPVGTGSIPNNKSDLKTFAVYVEPGTSAGDPGYLHVAWSRVQEPSGTTLMDFEFNQSTTKCANGVNPVRTVGDFLLEYRIIQGGARAELKLRTWSGSAWGAAADLTATGAIGDINETAIAAADGDGFGSLSPRTFGEASIDLDLIFDDTKCTSFGSAFVKSRSSDAFTSQLKDFIAPTPISLSNCGRVVIRKETVPDGLTRSFGFTHNLATDPASTTTFSLADGGSKTFTNVLLGEDYTVTEDSAENFDLTSIDCSASSGATPTVSLVNRRVTFDIEDPSDVVDCTFTNTRRAGAIIINKTRKHAASGSGDHPHAGVQFQVSGGGLAMPITVTTNALGVACVDGLDLSATPNNYTVTETVPAGYIAVGGSTKTTSVTNPATCLGGGGDVVNFANMPLTNLTVSVDSQVVGGTASTIQCTGMAMAVSTDVGGDGSVTRSDLVPGTYVCTVVIDP